MKEKMAVLSFLVLFALSSCKDIGPLFPYDPSDYEEEDIIESYVHITFKGKVVDADDGSPIQGARVYLQTTTADRVERNSDSVDIDKDGRYSLYYEGILGYHWTILKVDADRYFSQSQSILDFTTTLQFVDFELTKM